LRKPRIDGKAGGDLPRMKVLHLASAFFLLGAATNTILILRRPRSGRLEGWSRPGAHALVLRDAWLCRAPQDEGFETPTFTPQERL
jgi:hypothetical protein